MHRKNLYACLLVVVLAARVHPAAAQTDATAAELLRVQQHRLEATTANDLEALERILADELTYTHTTGQTETKNEFLATLRSGRLRYDAIEPADVQVRIYGDTGVVTGRAHLQVQTPIRAVALDLRFLEVYVRRDGRWQLVAYQSTRLP